MFGDFVFFKAFRYTSAKMSPFQKIELKEKSEDELRRLAQALKVSYSEIKRICENNQPAAVLKTTRIWSKCAFIRKIRRRLKGNFRRSFISPSGA